MDKRESLFFGLAWLGITFCYFYKVLHGESVSYFVPGAAMFWILFSYFYKVFSNGKD